MGSPSWRRAWRRFVCMPAIHLRPAVSAAAAAAAAAAAVSHSRRRHNARSLGRKLPPVGASLLCVDQSADRSSFLPTSEHRRRAGREARRRGRRVAGGWPSNCTSRSTSAFTGCMPAGRRESDITRPHWRRIAARESIFQRSKKTSIFIVGLLSKEADEERWRPKSTLFRLTLFLL